MRYTPAEIEHMRERGDLKVCACLFRTRNGEQVYECKRHATQRREGRNKAEWALNKIKKIVEGFE